MVSKVKRKNYGIDILRTIAMLMIIVLHLLGNGGVLSNLSRGTVNYYIMWLLEIFCYCAVNCYAIISGYVGYLKDNRFSKILYLYVQAVFYLILPAVCFTVFNFSDAGISMFIQAFLPFTVKQYWYFTSYLCLFFMMPILNMVAEMISKKKYRCFLIIFFILFSITPTLLNTDIFFTGSGYSPIWLAYMYLIGAYIKKYEVNLKRQIILVGYILCVVLTFTLKMIVEKITSVIYGEPRGSLIFINYTSPLFVIAAICLVIFFSRQTIKNISGKFISKLGKYTFGVYLIHTSPLIWNIYSNRIWKILTYTAPVNILIVCIITVGFFGVCIILEYIRTKLFIFFHVKQLCEKIQFNAWDNGMKE